MTIPIILGWSGGKDSALALNSLLADSRYEVVCLLTTLTRDFDRISMHGVRRNLLLRQAEVVELPLEEVWIHQGAGNAEYEAAMLKSIGPFRECGVTTMAFGDLFLEDIRDYREKMLRQLDMKCLFPIWGLDTTELAAEFVTKGFKAKTCCIDTRKLPESFCGRDLTSDFFNDLPAGVDPCGENGEFHTFVFDSPDFREPIEITAGEQRRDDPFLFCDLASRS
ncbi:MAG: adenine nucleotide alpha hydrolase [Rhodopirellula sp.]|nr:adenine nucleotide alpha hydrolase [Rhodopirellula sp.]